MINVITQRVSYEDQRWYRFDRKILCQGNHMYLYSDTREGIACIVEDRWIGWSIHHNSWDEVGLYAD